MSADHQTAIPELISRMSAAARQATAARNEAVNGAHTGRAWLDAHDRWAIAERTLSTAEDQLLEVLSNGR